jgi:D-glycero-beta-D-manno-heptose-7-phosphate kinase
LPVFSERRLTELFSSFGNKRIAVVGDLMIDKYIWGNVGRISPEAPVPVVEVEQETERLGGAANVANNINSLGGKPISFGVRGDDSNGILLNKLIEEQHCPTFGIIVDRSRPTTVKTRIIAQGQHIVRIDNEHKKNISPAVQQQLLDALKENISSIDGIIIEDYNKGVVVTALIHEIITLARKHDKIVAVDPKFNNFFEYKNVTVFKPNKKELEEAIGKKLNVNEDIENAGVSLLKKLKAESVLLTRGEKGMSLFEHDGAITHIPTKAREVADVSGAGDTVIATLIMALASGVSIREAAGLANHAAAIVCGEVGIVPIKQDVLKRSILSE